MDLRRWIYACLDLIVGYLELGVDMGYGRQLEVGGQVLLVLGQLPGLDIKRDATESEPAAAIELRRHAK